MSQNHELSTPSLIENMPINQIVNKVYGLSLQDCTITGQLRYNTAIETIFGISKQHNESEDSVIRRHGVNH